MNMICTSETNVTVYHCPADVRPLGFATGESARGPLQGKKIPNARSVSMSQAVGTNPYKQGKTAVDGPWLNGSHSRLANQTWFTFAKSQDMKRPGPANTMVILDENKYSMNDASFASVGPKDPPNYLMVDWPGIYHDGACGVAFGDAHSELHRWKDPRTCLNAPDSAVPVQEGNMDIWWISVRTTALIHGPDFRIP